MTTTTFAVTSTTTATTTPLIVFMVTNLPQPKIFSVVGNCIYSHFGTAGDFSDSYFPSVDCTFTVQTAGILSVKTFDLESCCDSVFFGETKYSGTAGPQEITVAAGDTLRFETDDLVQRSGFEICIE